MTAPVKVKLPALDKVRVEIPLKEPPAEKAPGGPAFNVKAFPPPTIDDATVMDPVPPDVSMTVAPARFKAPAPL